MVFRGVGFRGKGFKVEGRMPRMFLLFLGKGMLGHLRALGVQCFRVEGLGVDREH